MPGKITIFSYPQNYRVQKSLVAAQYNGVEIAVPAFEFGKDNVTAEFKAKFPLGKVPAMDTPQGPIFESNAMAAYVANLRNDTGLLGNTNYERAIVTQWIDFNTNEIEPCRGIWLYPIYGYLPYNEKNYTEAKKDLTASLKVLDSYLLHNTYLASNHVTLADIIIAVTLVELFSKVLDTKFAASIPNVVRWFNTCVHQPEFSKVVGKVTFATSELKAGAKPAASPAAKPVAAPAKPAAAAAADYDDEAPVAKKKNPLDDLPASSMVLDSMKKLCFSERPMKATFFEELWPQYDNAGYSWWTCQYKYNDENQVYFMTGNAVGGFIQRCDAARKYSMGVMNITGNEDEETGPFTISGAWLFRGTDFLADMRDENPDSEYYNWVKIDTTSAAGKATIKSQFLDEKLAGAAVLDRRYFK